ncbi:probable RNA-directed DNA polymerase from transposon BS [Trichonephila clavipes]|nr:probable RNA-directed DNA polymerase from transposon BS [Trichonephila clavipes]
MANYRGCPSFPKPLKGAAKTNRNFYTNIYNSLVRPNISYAQATTGAINEKNTPQMATREPGFSAQTEAKKPNPPSNRYNHNHFPNFNNRTQSDFKKELKKYNDNIWQKRLEALNTTDNSLWRTQRFFKSKRPKIPPLNCATGTPVTDQQKANLLATNIKNNFIENERDNDSYNHNDDIINSTVNNFLSTPPTTLIEPALPDEIIHYIKHVNAKKAPGKDLITNRMLKNFPIKLILILTILVNKILKFNHFPDNWKEAIIFPINKPGKDPHLASSYRPISLLSTIGQNSHLSIENKVLLYAAVMRPILAYASPVWGYATKTNINKLDTLQNSLIRMIVKATRYMRNDDIRNDLKINSFKTHIQNIAINFFTDLDTTNNVNMQNLIPYTPNDNTKRPRRILLDSYNPP